MEDLIALLVAAILLVVCYFIGSFIEKKHYKSIKARELMLYKKPYLNIAKKVNTSLPVKKSSLVASSVVLGCDHFKTFVASLKNLFGGNISAYESVLDRARREAVLRVREKALAMNAHMVVNIKIETVMLTPLYASQKNQQPQVCVTAYGTAIEYDK